MSDSLARAEAQLTAARERFERDPSDANLHALERTKARVRALRLMPPAPAAPDQRKE